MSYLIFAGGILLLFAVLLFLVGVIGRGWGLWSRDESGGGPRRSDRKG